MQNSTALHPVSRRDRANPGAILSSHAGEGENPCLDLLVSYWHCAVSSTFTECGRDCDVLCVRSCTVQLIPDTSQTVLTPRSLPNRCATEPIALGAVATVRVGMCRSIGDCRLEPHCDGGPTALSSAKRRSLVEVHEDRSTHHRHLPEPVFGHDDAIGEGGVFLVLHEGDGAFIIPNPWEVRHGKAVGSSRFQGAGDHESAGYAFSVGKRDYKVGRDEMVVHVGAIALATDLPVSAMPRERLR